MEAYYEFQIDCDHSVKEALIAELSEEHFEGFLENESGFSAFIPQSLFNQATFEAILSQYKIDPVSVPQNTIEDQNWNAQWEASFLPITIGTDIIVKAPFHIVDENYKYEIIIQPKNTFGTGHHETTQLVLHMMLQINFSHKHVFDYGCGTGVLGIFASRLGADDVYAIDIDEWSAENIHENCALNGVQNIRFNRGDLDTVTGRSFDVILANINKNILLASFARLSQLLVSNGQLIISGFYENDLADLKMAAEASGLQHREHLVKNEWCAALFRKTT
jgi:ribosomal protein L11 methyltransferase